MRAWAQRAEELGFTHVLAYDHVAGADPAVHTGWDGPYDVHTTFHEPMVLYGYLAAVTSMELVTGVIILERRQEVTVLIAGLLRAAPGQSRCGQDDCTCPRGWRCAALVWLAVHREVTRGSP